MVCMCPPVPLGPCFIEVILFVYYHHCHPLSTESITLDLSCLSSFKALAYSLEMVGFRWQPNLSTVLVSALSSSAAFGRSLRQASYTATMQYSFMRVQWHNSKVWAPS